MQPAVAVFAQSPAFDEYELLEGQVHPMSPESVAHQKLIARLDAALRRFIEAAGVGELYHNVRVDLSPTDRPVPDLCFLSSEHLHLEREASLAGAPDVIWEVLSPATQYNDLHLKPERYRLHGVAEYHVLNPYTLECHSHLFGQGTPGIVMQQGQFTSPLLGVRVSVRPSDKVCTVTPLV